MTFVRRGASRRCAEWARVTEMGKVRFFKRAAAVVIGASLVFGGVTAGVGSITPVASAQEAQAAKQTYVDVDALNVRSLPTLSGTITTTLSYGTVVALVGGPTTADGYVWYQVQQGGTTLGWSVNGFTTRSVPVGGGTIPTTPTTPTIPSGTFIYGDPVMVNTDLLNVRSLPSINASVLDVYGYGTVALVTGDATVADGYTWYPVDNLGWVAGQFLTSNGNGGGSTPPSSGGNSDGDFSFNDSATVNTDILNLRTAPSISAAIVDVYTYGAFVTISGEPTVADGITWYPVNFSGWVAGQYLVPADPDAFDVVPLYVTTDVLNVRSSPSLNGTIVGTRAYLDVVVINGEPGYASDGSLWWAINPSRTQWVSGLYISLHQPGQQL